MSDHDVPSTDPYDPDLDPDTDPTMTAPEGGRPDGGPAMKEGEQVDQSGVDDPAEE